MTSIPSSRDKLLFTPGPLTTSLSVKQAMLHDAGSWDVEFNSTVANVRQKLLELGGVSRESGFEVILMQGSGTFGVESVISSVLPPNGKLLVLANGAYGERIAQMAMQLRIKHLVLRSAEDQTADLAELNRTLENDFEITNVAVVHCETTTGILNPIERIGPIIKAAGRVLIVDAMSSFGSVAIDMDAIGIDYLISSANKCVEGVPGFSFIFARRSLLLATEGFARTLSLDLLGQWKAFEKTAQFRYTPPTHAVLAFVQALKELDAEGGIAARGARYKRNHQVLIEGMERIGFKRFLPDAIQSCIITCFHFPKDPKFNFAEFYRLLSAKGMIIYPGKLTQVPTFRIGNIGRLFENDIRQLLSAIELSISEMNVTLAD
ncbi:MAG: 2-aminoethylphosphonate--pyruvate transaminase [Verrucomicrobiales bacterium]|nr:2-aminoethylphosphonate--pyruvate transaminase [Verrucomicrobiales bacterium]